jgi:AAA+ ATPase superfamily predicted ATPase
MAYADHLADATRFLDSGIPRHSLALVYGRRRIGKSTLLSRLARERRGFYWEATRADTAVHLARLGTALGEQLGTGPLQLASWEDALSRLLRWGAEGNRPVVLDEFGYLLDAEPALDSIVATVLGPARRSEPAGTRLVLCGSAMALMRHLTGGHAPLRGRAGLELLMHPMDDREAAVLHRTTDDLPLAARLYAVIGGVAGYATDMVDDDLPSSARDFARWVTTRILSPAATLHHEASTLLAEDPTLAAASQPLHHSLLAVIANGAVTAGTMANALRRQVAALDPALKRLVAAGFVVRHEDPLRGRRPLYALADPFLQFHYAVLEPHGMLLRERPLRDTWEQRLAPVFDARVRGPVFEEQARAWVRRHAAIATIGGPAEFVGPSSVKVDGVEHQLDVVAAAAAPQNTEPMHRTVVAIGEAKCGELVGETRLRHLERARAALGANAAGAKLLLFAPRFTPALRALAERRGDVELVDLPRLYTGD